MTIPASALEPEPDRNQPRANTPLPSPSAMWAQQDDATLIHAACDALWILGAATRTRGGGKGLAVGEALAMRVRVRVRVRVRQGSRDP